MSPANRLRPARPGSLRARIFAVLRECSFPASTFELCSACAADLPNGMVRVLQVLYREELYGRVRRIGPAGPMDPTGPRPGRPPMRWALTPLGLMVAGGGQ